MLVILTREIRFKGFDGQWVIFKEGEDVYVDLEELIAYRDGHHFDIAKNEFTVIN